MPVTPLPRFQTTRPSCAIIKRNKSGILTMNATRLLWQCGRREIQNRTVINTQVTTTAPQEKTVEERSSIARRSLNNPAENNIPGFDVEMQEIHYYSAPKRNR